MFLRHPLLSVLGVDHGFGTLHSPSRPSCSTYRQIHGTRVVSVAGNSPAGEPIEADGLLSNQAGMEVGIWTADCLPVLMATLDGRYVGALHAGWRGAVSGIVRVGLERMKEASGGNLSLLRVVLGPAIGPCCFDVGPEVWDAVEAGTPGYSIKERKKLDLWDLVTHQLMSSGVLPSEIGRVSLCTRCHPALFYSHRGWGPERKGRSMLNYIRPTVDDF